MNMPTTLRLLALFLILLFRSSPVADRCPQGEEPSVATDTTHEVPSGVTPSDWAGIRAAHEAQRHGVQEVAGGHQAKNPGQRWMTRFDGRGFAVQPDAGGWTWGLELERYGFEGAERPVVEPTGVRAEGQRMAYDWDATLEEWYVNDARGLEHGYTVHQRPEQGTERGPGLLSFVLGVRGTLRAQADADGRGIRFLDSNDAIAVSYTGLTVFDADGKDLPARLETVSDGLRVLVDDTGARYPLTVDPVAQQEELKGSNTEQGDHFGRAVAISGNTLVVGARLESSAASGVNGDENDNSLSQSGAAYVFVKNGTTWTQEAYLKASNPDRFDNFGGSVSVSGDTVVIGAISEDSNATGINGNQAANSGTDSGAAYVFVRVGTTWTQQAYLKAPGIPGSSNRFANFGEAVSIADDTIVVGAHRADLEGFDRGAVYVFERIGTTWIARPTLVASDRSDGDEFGSSVALSPSAGTLAVGAHKADFFSGGFFQAGDTGKAYVFERLTSASADYAEQAVLTATNPAGGDGFGTAVAASDEVVVVGAPLEDSIAGNSGAAFVFARDGGSWSQQAMLKASNAGIPASVNLNTSPEFGRSVAIADETIVVGAVKVGNLNGAVYEFVRTGTIWNEESIITQSPNPGNYGISVAISGSTLAIGSGHNVRFGGQGGSAFLLELSGTSGTHVLATPVGAWPVGTSQLLTFDVPSTPGELYGMAASDALVSGATGLIPPIDTTSPLFELSLSTPAIFEDFLGVLDGSGSATAQVNIPNLPGLSGFVIHFAGATLGAGGSLTGMSNPVTITIQ